MLRSQQAPATACLPLLFVEGNIGSGKTTLCQAVEVAADGGATVMQEEIDANLLRLFYSDKRRYAFAFQLHMAESRTNASLLRLLRLEQVGIPRAVLFDRSVMGDFVFACANYVTGSISSDEMSVYAAKIGARSLQKVGSVIEQAFRARPWRLIYLHSPAKECKWRIDNMRKTVEADAVPLPYYELIEMIYVNALLWLAASGRACVVPWADYENSALIACFLLQNQRPWAGAKAFGGLTTTAPPAGVMTDRLEEIGARWFDLASQQKVLEQLTVSVSP